MTFLQTKIKSFKENLNLKKQLTKHYIALIAICSIQTVKDYKKQ